MSELDYTVSGSFTATGQAVEIDLAFQPDWVEVRVQGNASGNTWTSSANPGVVKEAFWYSGMAQDTALATVNTDSAATDEKRFVSANGIMQRLEDPTALGNAVSGTAITAANPAEATANAHGFQNGDVILITESTGMRQIAGLPFTIGSVATNTFELTNLDASGFAAAATNLEARRVLYPNLFKPGLRYITDVSASGTGTTIIKFSVNIVGASGFPEFGPNQEVRITMPEEFGATELNGEKVTVLNVTPSQIEVDFDPSSLSAFSFPTSSVAAQGMTFPHVVPVGTQVNSIPNNADAFRNTTARGFTIGTNVAASGAGTILWKAGLSSEVV